MFYVISQSTDLRCPRTEVRKFSSLCAARRFAGAGNGKYTCADPESARNWHHTLKRIWELQGRINRKDPIFQDRGTRCYPRNAADNLASHIETYGSEIPDDLPAKSGKAASSGNARKNEAFAFTG